MSDEPKLTRRQVLSFWKKGEPTTGVERRSTSDERTSSASQGSFSLDVFYAKRSHAETSPNTIPHFQLRPGLAPVATTQVGTPELGPSTIAGAPITRTAPSPYDGPPNAHVVASRLRIHRGRCLAWQRSFCTTCSERCPEQGAIRLEEGRPSVDDARCTRCGICIAVCPAPINAFEIVDDGSGVV